MVREILIGWCGFVGKKVEEDKKKLLPAYFGLCGKKEMRRYLSERHVFLVIFCFGQSCINDGSMSAMDFI